LEGGQVLIDAEVWDAIVNQDDELRAELAQERNERDATAVMLGEARAEIRRLRQERNDAIDAEKVALRAIGQVNERLRAALEKIANAPDNLHAGWFIQIATDALGAYD